MEHRRKNVQRSNVNDSASLKSSERLKSSFIRMAAMMAAAGLLLLAAWIIPWLKAPVYSQKALSDIEQAVLSVNDPAFYPEQNAQAIRRYLSISEEDAEEVGFFRQDDAFSAREIIIARFENESQKQILTEKIEQRKQNQIEIYSGYAPEQEAMMQDAIFDVQGNYLLFYTGTEGEASDQAFLDALRRDE